MTTAACATTSAAGTTGRRMTRKSRRAGSGQGVPPGYARRRTDSPVAPGLAAEHGESCGITFQAPVLVVDAAVLVHVEPDEAEQVEPAYPGEQVRDLVNLPRHRPRRSLR